MMKHPVIILALSALSTFVVAGTINCNKTPYVDDHMGPWTEINRAALRYPGGAGNYLKLGQQATEEGYSYTGESKICARVKNEQFTLPSEYYESYMIAGKKWCQAEMDKEWSDTYGPSNCDCHSAGFLFQYVALTPASSGCPNW